MADESAWSRILIAVIAASAAIAAALISSGLFRHDPEASSLSENWIGEWEGKWADLGDEAGSADNKDALHLDDAGLLWRMDSAIHLKLNQETSPDLYKGELTWRVDLVQKDTNRPFPPVEHCNLAYTISLRPGQSSNKASYQLSNRRVVASETTWCEDRYRGIDASLREDSGMLEASPNWSAVTLLAGSFFPPSHRFQFVRQP